MSHIQDVVAANLELQNALARVRYSARLSTDAYPRRAEFAILIQHFKCAALHPLLLILKQVHARCVETCRWTLLQEESPLCSLLILSPELER